MWKVLKTILASTAIHLFHINTFCGNGAPFPLLCSAARLLDCPTLLSVSKTRETQQRKQNASTFAQTIRNLSSKLSSFPVTLYSFPFVSYSTRLRCTKRRTRKSGISTHNEKSTKRQPEIRCGRYWLTSGQ